MNPTAEIPWIEGVDLSTGGAVLVPFEAVTLSCVLATGQRPAIVPSSNGLASGNHLLEATVHGLCEVIERDAVAKWQRAGGSAGGVGKLDLPRIEDPACAEVIRDPDSRRRGGGLRYHQRPRDPGVRRRGLRRRRQSGVIEDRGLRRLRRPPGPEEITSFARSPRPSRAA